MDREQIIKTLTTALEIIKTLQEENKKLTNERDMHKRLKDVESHRMKIATKTIEDYENELGVNYDGYDPHDSEEKQQRKAKAERKSRCIRYLNEEYGYHLN